VKFDPSDQEIIWHLLAKVSDGGIKPHPFIKEFIPTVDNDDGICYTHPQNLPGWCEASLIFNFDPLSLTSFSSKKKIKKIQVLSKMAVYPTSFIEQSKHTILGLESVERFKVIILVMSAGTRLAGPNQ
jgi:hypothetical protein